MKIYKAFIPLLFLCLSLMSCKKEQICRCTGDISTGEFYPADTKLDDYWRERKCNANEEYDPATGMLKKFCSLTDK